MESKKRKPVVPFIDICAYVECSNNRQQVSLYCFPKKTNPLCGEWLSRICNPALKYYSCSTLRRMGVCEEHFTPEMFKPTLRSYPNGRKVLKKNAVPEPSDHLVQKWREKLKEFMAARQIKRDHDYGVKEEPRETEEAEQQQQRMDQGKEQHQRQETVKEQQQQRREAEREQQQKEAERKQQQQRKVTEREQQRKETEKEQQQQRKAAEKEVQRQQYGIFRQETKYYKQQQQRQETIKERQQEAGRYVEEQEIEVQEIEVQEIEVQEIEEQEIEEQEIEEQEIEEQEIEEQEIEEQEIEEQEIEIEMCVNKPTRVYTKQPLSFSDDEDDVMEWTADEPSPDCIALGESPLKKTPSEMKLERENVKLKKQNKYLRTQLKYLKRKLQRSIITRDRLSNELRKIPK